jgi:hypothetical protein
MWRYQLVLHPHSKGTPNRADVIAVHEAYFTAPETEIPDSITAEPTDVHGDTVAEVRETLRRMIAACDYPLLNWDGFPEVGAEPPREGKFAWVCPTCDTVYTAHHPILRCPVEHAPPAL